MKYCVLPAVVLSLLAVHSTAQLPTRPPGPPPKKPKDGCPPDVEAASRLYHNNGTSCSDAQTCETSYLSCLGSVLNCSLAHHCIAQRIQCTNAVAENTADCPELNGLYMSIMLAGAGDFWNTTDAFKSCQASTCRWLNSTYTGLGTNCTLGPEMCPSPFKFVATMLLKGDFVALLNDPGKRRALADVIAMDLEHALHVHRVRVLHMYLSASKTTLIVEFEVDESNKNTVVAGHLNTIKTSHGDFLKQTSSFYTAETGGNLVFEGVAEGTASNAFSDVDRTPIPSAPSSSSAGSASSSGSVSGDGATTSGAATQSIAVLLSALVAVLPLLL